MFNKEELLSKRKDRLIKQQQEFEEQENKRYSEYFKAAEDIADFVLQKVNDKTVEGYLVSSGRARITIPAYIRKSLWDCNVEEMVNSRLSEFYLSVEFHYRQGLYEEDDDCIVIRIKEQKTTNKPKEFLHSLVDNLITSIIQKK